MCGILAILGLAGSAEESRAKALELQKKIRHRGPDWSGCVVTGSNAIAHERLAIVDPLSGNQPLYSHEKTRSLAVNGEIYNHKALRAKMVPAGEKRAATSRRRG